MVVRPGDKVEIPGVYLPDVDHACAQFLHPYRTNQLKPDLLHVRGMGEISVHQGLQRDEYGDWEEERQVVPTWTLVRRVESQFLLVPPEGFYPKTSQAVGGLRVDKRALMPVSGGRQLGLMRVAALRQVRPCRCFLILSMGKRSGIGRRNK